MTLLKDTDLITRAELRESLLKLTSELTIDLASQTKRIVNQTVSGFAARLYKDLPKIIAKAILQGLNLDESIDTTPIATGLEQTLSAELTEFGQAKSERKRQAV